MSVYMKSRFTFLLKVKDPAACPGLVEFFFDELQNVNYEVRLHCVNKLDTMALAMGPEIFRKNIDKIFDAVSDDDSLIAILVEKLPSVLAYIGGIPQAQFLVSKIGGLLTHLNQEIRCRAMASVNSLLRYYNYKQMLQEFIPIIKKTYDFGTIVSKLSCIGMLVNFYRRGNPSNRIIIRRMLIDMANDSNCLIRAEVCVVTSELLNYVPKDAIYREFFPLFQKLSKDPELTVRAASLSILAPLSVRITQEHKSVYMLPLIEASLKDESDEIRKIIVDLFLQLFKLFRDSDTRYSLMKQYVALLGDCEPEVVKKVISHLEELIKELLPDEKFKMCDELIKPHIISLATKRFPDDDIIIMLSFITCIVASHLTEEIIVKDLIPVVKLFLKSTCDRVRASIAENLYLLNDILSKETIQEHLVSFMRQLSADFKWNVRVAAAKWHCHLALLMGFDFFETHLRQLFMNHVSDPIAAVREESVNCLVKLVKRFGYQSQISFVPVVVNHIKNPHYLIRIACVNLLSALIPICTKDIVEELILPTLVKLASDPVANVKLKTAKGFLNIIPQLDARCIELFVRPCLGDLMDDKDPDVIYFASEALDTIKEYFKDEDDEE